MKFVSLFILFIFQTQLSFASDHIDGPVTQSHRVADLTDFYVFPSPLHKGHLSLILNTYPIVPKNGHFTDKATYVFLLRKAQVNGLREKTGFLTSNEVVINCRFVTPRDHHAHTVTCKTSNGMTAKATYNKTQSSQGDFDLYAGMRSDPFFFWAKFAQEAANNGVLLAPKNENTMDRINCLSIVIDINIEKLFSGNSPELIAAAAAVITKDSASAPIRILDRIGRPEITNVSMFTPKGRRELRDEYNVHRPFVVSEQVKKDFAQRLSDNIAHYDKLDKKMNWTDSDKASFVNLLVEDYLIVAPQKNCTGDHFLGIEKNLIASQAIDNCGGRKPTDDIMDTLFSIYISGLNGKVIRDGVDQPTKPISKLFPYLADPSLDLISLSKAAIARKLLGLQK